MSLPLAFPYLTAEQVAELLQVSPKRSVYRWAQQDPTMPKLKIGGIVRFPWERLERWLRDREQGRPRRGAQVFSAGTPVSDRGGAPVAKPPDVVKAGS